MPDSQLVELHGNSLLEACGHCDRKFRHDALVHDVEVAHLTGQASIGRGGRGLSTGQMIQRRIEHIEAVDPQHLLLSSLTEEDRQPHAERDAALANNDAYSGQSTSLLRRAR